MTGRDDPVTDAQLEAMAQLLQRAVAARDSVPQSVLDHAAHALELRDVDAELAALVEDSADRDEQLALVRGPEGTRLLTFEAPGVVVELQVTPSGDRRRVQGHVAGATGAELSLEHPGGVADVTPDEHGRFWVDTVPSGRLRLRLRAESRAVTTTWVDV